MAHDIDECECEACKNGMAAFLERLATLVQRHGCAVISTVATIEDANVAMAYTVGLADKSLPELIVFGLPAETALVLLNSAARLALAKELPVGTPVGQLATLPVIFKNVAPEDCEDYIVQAVNRAGRPVPALQMIWPDAAGRFPWEPSAQELGQPLLPFRALH